MTRGGKARNEGESRNGRARMDDSYVKYRDWGQSWDSAISTGGERRLGGPVS